MGVDLVTACAPVRVEHVAAGDIRRVLTVTLPEASSILTSFQDPQWFDSFLLSFYSDQLEFIAGI